jgi:hypothetical protein
LFANGPTVLFSFEQIPGWPQREPILQYDADGAVGAGARSSAQRRQNFFAPEIEHFGNIGSERNAKRNLREFIAGPQ